MQVNTTVELGYVIIVGYVEFVSTGITQIQAEASVIAALCEKLNVSSNDVEAIISTLGSAESATNTTGTRTATNAVNNTSVANSKNGTVANASVISAQNTSAKGHRQLRGYVRQLSVTTWVVQYAVTVPVENAGMVQDLSQTSSSSVASFERLLQQELTASGASVPPDFSILRQAAQTPNYSPSLVPVATNPNVKLSGSVQFLATGISQSQARMAFQQVFVKSLGVTTSQFSSVIVQYALYNTTGRCSGNPSSNCAVSYNTWLVTYALEVLPSQAQAIKAAAAQLLQSQGQFQILLQDQLQITGCVIPLNFFCVGFGVPVQSAVASPPPMLLLDGSFSFLAAAITQEQAFAGSITALTLGLNINASNIYSIAVSSYRAQGFMLGPQGRVPASRRMQTANVTVNMWLVKYKLLVLNQLVPAAVQNQAQLYNVSSVDFQTILTNELINVGAFVPSDFYLAGFSQIVVDQSNFVTTTLANPDAGNLLNEPEQVCFFGCRPKSQGLVVVAIFIAVLIALMIMAGLAFLYCKGFVQIDFGWDQEGKDEAELRRLEDERWQLAEAVVGQEEPPFKVPEAWTGYSASKEGGGAGRKYRLNFLVGGKVEGTSQVLNRFFTVQGAYDLQDGHVAWREEAMPEVWERTSNIFEFAGMIRVRRVRSAELAAKTPVDDFGWVNLREYDPLVPFDGEGYYAHEIIGDVTSFCNEGKTELMAKEQLQVRTEASWAPPLGDNLKLPKKKFGLFGF